MKRLLLSLALALSVFACSSSDDLVSTDATEAVGESEDGLSGLPLREITFNAPLFSTDAESRKLFTSADSFMAYFGQKPPSGIDFSNEWVAFYSAGIKNTGGYTARVTRVRMVADELRVSTRLDQPGNDCFVTMALTRPYTLVAFAKPTGASWLRFTRYTKTNNCTENPCNLVDCMPGTKCVEVAGEAECQPLPGSCGTMKCAGGFNCIDDENGKGQCVPLTSCAATLCITGTHCVDDPVKGAMCLPTVTCANIKCQSGTHCEENNGNANCVPDLTCASMLCAPGSYCTEFGGKAHCEPYTTCANVKCGYGMTCVDLPIYCITEPCPPSAPQCVSGTFKCPTTKYVNCMPPTTNAACSNPQKAWIQANCPGVEYVY